MHTYLNMLSFPTKLIKNISEINIVDNIKSALNPLWIQIKFKAIEFPKLEWFHI